MLDMLLNQINDEKIQTSFEQSYFNLTASMEELEKANLLKAMGSGYINLPTSYLDTIVGGIKKLAVSGKKRNKGYMVKIDKLKTDFKSKEDQFDDKISVLLNIGGLSSTFIKNGKYTTTPLADIKDDHKLINDIYEYTKVTSKAYVDLVTKDLPSFLTDDKKPKHPLVNFPDKWIGYKDLLYNTKLSISDSWSANPALINASQLAKVKLDYGYGGGLGALKSLIAKPVSINKSEVLGIIEALEKKADNLDDIIDGFEDISSDIVKSSKSFNKVLKIALKKNNDNIRKDVADQMISLQKNLLANMVDPAKGALKRELDLINGYINWVSQINRSLLVNKKKDD